MSVSKNLTPTNKQQTFYTHPINSYKMITIQFKAGIILWWEKTIQLYYRKTKLIKAKTLLKVTDLTVLVVSLATTTLVKIKINRNCNLVNNQIVRFILRNRPRIKTRRLKIKTYLKLNKMWGNLILVNKIKLLRRSNRWFRNLSNIQEVNNNNELVIML